jgi:hypothetical protein
MKQHLFEDIGVPLDIDHGVQGVGPYHIFSVEIQVCSTTVNDTIGWVPYGEGEVWHPGGGVHEVEDESTVSIIGLSFSDGEEEHMYEWREGKFAVSPDPMPISDEQLSSIMGRAMEYIENHLDEIDF